MIAHRGASGFAPESTKASYEIARDLGADYLEIDLQVSKDGQLVVFHDDDLLKKTDVAKKFPDRKSGGIKDFTLAELKSLDAGSWFNDANPKLKRDSYKGLQIQTLAEVIDIAGASKTGRRPGLYIETKNPQLYPDVELKLKNLLEEKQWNKDDGRVVLQTFDKGSLEKMNRLFPTYPKVLLLWQGEGYMEKLEDYESFLEFARRNGAQGVGPDFEKLLEPDHIAMIKARKLFVHAYTVDEEKDFQALDKKLNGVKKTGYFTNRADFLLDHWGRAHPPIDEVAHSLGYVRTREQTSRDQLDTSEAGIGLPAE